MKKKLLTSLVLLSAVVSLAGCGSKTKTLNPNGVEKLYVADESSAIYLNITEAGLYKGEQGKLIENSNIEYGVKLTNLKTGDALPTTDMGARAHNVSFKTWCYYNNGDGMLTYTTKVVESVNLYHAVFTYTGTYDGNYYYNSGSTETKPTTSQTTETKPSETVTSGSATTETATTEAVVGDVYRYYFIDQSWWNDSAAATAIYLFKGEENNTWPGEKMTHVKYDEETKCNTWYADVDLSVYTSALFVRVSGDGKTDWGAKTKTVELTKEFNTVKLSEKSAVWGDPGCNFETAIVIY